MVSRSALSVRVDTFQPMAHPKMYEDDDPYLSELREVFHLETRAG